MHAYGRWQQFLLRLRQEVCYTGLNQSNDSNEDTVSFDQATTRLAVTADTSSVEQLELTEGLGKKLGKKLQGNHHYPNSIVGFVHSIFDSRVIK